MVAKQRAPKKTRKSEQKINQLNRTNNLNRSEECNKKDNDLKN